MASSCFLHSPLYHFPLLPPPPPPPPSPSPSSRSRDAHTNAKFRGIVSPIACLRKDESAFRNKRTVLFTGTSFLALRRLRAKAFEGLARKESAVKTPQYSQNHEIAPRKSGSPYVFLSLLNGKFVTISSVMLGAVCGLLVALKERTTADAAIETMNRKLKEREQLISFLKRHYEAAVLDKQKEQIKRLGSAINQLNSASSTVTFMEQQLQSKENFIEELKLQIDRIETQLAKAKADKKDVQRRLEEKIDSVVILDEKSHLLILELKDKTDVNDFLHKLLTDRKNGSKQTQKNFEDAQNHVKNLGRERENLESKAKKLQEELASAKGEILRLRSQNISSSMVVTNEQVQKDEGESQVTANVEKNVTREERLTPNYVGNQFILRFILFRHIL